MTDTPKPATSLTVAPEPSDQTPAVVPPLDADFAEVLPEPAAGLTAPAVVSAPWAIKSMPLEERNAALAAAKRADMSMGDWLALAIRTQIKHERDQERGLVPISTEPPPLDDIERMVAMAQRMADATRKPTPATVARLAYAQMRARLAPGLPQPKQPKPDAKRSDPARRKV